MCWFIHVEIRNQDKNQVFFILLHMINQKSMYTITIAYAFKKNQIGKHSVLFS